MTSPPSTGHTNLRVVLKDAAGELHPPKTLLVPMHWNFKQLYEQIHDDYHNLVAIEAKLWVKRLGTDGGGSSSSISATPASFESGSSTATQVFWKTQLEPSEPGKHSSSGGSGNNGGGGHANDCDGDGVVGGAAPGWGGILEGDTIELEIRRLPETSGATEGSANDGGGGGSAGGALGEEAEAAAAQIAELKTEIAELQHRLQQQKVQLQSEMGGSAVGDSCRDSAA